MKCRPGLWNHRTLRETLCLTEQVRPGMIVPCPMCRKPVKLRMPFNGTQTSWIQVPNHNRAE